MNDEASSSAAAYPPHEDGQRAPEAAPTETEIAEKRKENRQLFNKKRGALLDDLLRNLDILVYAQLSVIYYMDCSFLSFLFRALIQFLSLTPKPATFPHPPVDRPYIGMLLGSNMICFFLHWWLSAPSAGEATRGYLHGGLAMDFIGQQGPTSKLHLLLLDLLVLTLQLVHLSADMTRKRLKGKMESPPTASAATTAAVSAPLQPTRADTQDLDSEERGVRRSDEQQDIEMQNLNPSGTAATDTPSNSADDSSERDSLLATTAPRTDAHIFDAFNSGQIVVADLDIWKNVKEQMQLAKEARLDSNSLNQNLRAELAGRILRLRIGTDILRQTL